VPEFWLGIMLILVFVVYLNLLPAAGRTGGWTHWILPSVTAGWFSMAGLLRITRSSVLEVLGSDYIRTARAKGLRERNVLWGHTVRNSLITVITSVALLSVGLMNGIVLVETVFGWPGLGQLFALAVLSRDLFLVQGMTLLIGTAFLVANFLADILYSIVDPRIRLAS
jgi:ABC-type dipeptide/oligopeptide/nickel transport system permease component